MGVLFESLVYIFYYGNICGVMVTNEENGHGESSSNPGLDICISYIANSIWKGANPIILPPAMSK